MAVRRTLRPWYGILVRLPLIPFILVGAIGEAAFAFADWASDRLPG